LDISVIKEYLVRLGFDVRQPELQKFNDALRSATQQVEKISAGMAKTFVTAGGAVLTTLAAIATGTVGLAEHVSQSDLSLQVWAKRMYLSTDAARSLKNATDALGYSLEDIIWGPKELQERFGVLMTDQKQMQAGLGPDFELQMRRIRDVRFEFTRLGETLQYLSMNVVASLGRRLFGEEGGVGDFMKGFLETIIPKLPEIGDKIAKFLINTFTEVKNILVGIYGVIKTIVGFIDSNPLLKKALEGTAIGGAASTAMGLGPLPGAIIGAAGGVGSFFSNGVVDKNKIQDQIVATAKSLGLDPAIALAIAQQESGFNPGAKSNKGALGLFQLMPGTAAGMGVDPKDPNQNIRGGIGYLLQLYRKYKDWTKAFIAYNEGPGTFDKGIIYPSAQNYADEAIRNSAKWRASMENGTFGLSGDISPISYRGGTSVGDITIHINQPNATPDQIHKAVVKAIDDKAAKQTQRNIAQLGGAMA
jgi:hypothetical protein